jgi:sec-independent protein translocase protein TatB
VFDVAFSELIVIGILALIVLGPKRLPEVARTAGQWMGKLRTFVENAKRDMNAEMHRAELAELRQVKDQLIETKNAFEQATTSPFNSLNEIQSPAASTPALPAPAAKTRRRAAVKKKKKPTVKARRRVKPHGRTKR